MENKITTFTSEEFGNVRTLMIGGEPWFVGKDVALALGYKNPQEAIRNHVFDEDKGVSEFLTPGGKQKIPVINESGLYSLVLASKLPSARKFKHWVTSEVLPTIRKHGTYMTESMLQKVLEHPELIMVMAEQLMQEHNRAENLSAMLQQVQPKAEYYDTYINPEDCTNIRATAKELQVPERQFCKFLVEAKFMYRCPAGNLMPYNKPGNEGLFIVRDYCTSSGHKGVYTLITPLGKDRIRIKLMENPDG